jgi:hypothetical protein
MGIVAPPRSGRTWQAVRRPSAGAQVRGWIDRHRWRHIDDRTCGNLRERRAGAGRRPVLAGYMRLTAALLGAGSAASSTGSSRQTDGSERYADTLSVAEDCVTVRGQFESRPMRGSLTDARQSTVLRRGRSCWKSVGGWHASSRFFGRTSSGDVNQLRRLRVSACLHFRHNGASRFSELALQSNPHQSRTWRVVMARRIRHAGSTSAKNATRFIGFLIRAHRGVTTWRTRKDGKPTARKRLTKDVRPRRTPCRRAPDRLPVARRPPQRARVASGIRRSVSRSGGIRSPVVRWVPGRAWGDSTSGCTGCIQSRPRHRSSTPPQAPPPHRKGTETWTHDSRDRGDPL